MHKKINTIAKQVFEIQANSIEQLSKRLDDNFYNSVQALYNCKGRVVVSGMGKSGIIAQKIAATLSSTGTASFFLHPSEAIHGDLGMLREEDCFVSISNSGETDELLGILAYVKQMKLKHICLVGKQNSTLTLHADYVLDVSVEEEASELAVVPMASTTVALVMGDALAAALIHLKTFEAKDFALLHPGGTLGKKLLLKVSDCCQRLDLPIVSPHCSTRELLVEMSKGRLGIAIVKGEDESILGVVTDGDIRRAINRYSNQAFFEAQALDLMSSSPKHIEASQALWEAEQLMQLHKITSLLVFEEAQFIGILSKHDIP